MQRAPTTRSKTRLGGACETTSADTAWSTDLEAAKIHERRFAHAPRWSTPLWMEPLYLKKNLRQTGRIVQGGLETTMAEECQKLACYTFLSKSMPFPMVPLLLLIYISI